MSAGGEPPPPTDEDSRSRDVKPVKDKKKRRRSRSKQKESADSQMYEAEFPPDDDGNTSNSSTPIYERPDESIYPVGGSICALCYCGEKSLLGQGDITRYSATPGFNPFKKPPLRARGSRELIYGSSPGSNGSQESYNVGEKVTKTAAQRRGSKQMRESMKTTPKQVEYVDELSTVGSSEILDVGLVFEPSGHVTAHHCCAAWSEGVTQNESYNLLCVDKAVHAGMSQRCHSCSRYGATIKCRSSRCERLFHYPCAAGSGCFQDIKSMSLLCPDHLELAPTIADPDELNCAVCDSPGQISDLLFCTSCGHHYHGDCLDPHVDVNPVVRAGWQCPECKICQTCRQPGDDNKMLVCDVCDKGYHTFCLRPAMSFIPKNGWCCKNCRRCTDCGSRTPGNGPSSRWHINYQVCDKCYQLRNKGHYCPVCSKAYRNIPAARADMILCTSCKKYVHWNCENPSHLEASQKSEEDYKCPVCRNPPPDPSLALSTSVFPPDPVQQSPIEMPVTPSEFTFNTPPPESSSIDVQPKETDQDMKTISSSEPLVPQSNQAVATSTPRKRASTSSVGSEKGVFALKGNSLDPMLSVGDDSNDQSTFSKTGDFASPPRKVRHISSDDTATSRDRIGSQPSTENNLSSIFTDENAQDAMSLFGVDSLPQSAPRLPPSAMPAMGALSPEMKTFKMADESISPQPKVTLSPIGSPHIYALPSSKPPGPGIGKPGAMFGKGKPFGHKKKPATARSRGKGKGKGQKRGGFSGPRKRPKGGKGSAMITSTERTVPRRARRGFQRQASAAPAVVEEGLASPVSGTRMEPTMQLAHADDEYGDSMHNTVVLCSADDNFTLMQDMCVVCGSFGQGSEGRLIACSQCGQCYHPYCVNLKLTKVVLRKGWRCLDCTVCEECGQVDDPAHLLLCDDCDISYHTHCLKPPLLHVPKGGWKCKWCVRCVYCGATSPGKNCEWASNYTACGPCASANHCPKCRRSYRDDDIIMQCGTCERWLHSACELLMTEADIEKVLEMGYECVFCRPKDATPPHLMLAQSTDQDQANMYMGRTRSEVENVKEYQKDNTALTIAGLQHIQKLMQKHMGLYKKKPAPARGRSRKPSDVQEKLEVPPVLPTLQNIKPKEASGQTINVADAVKALQDPSEVYRKLSEEGSKESMDTTPALPDAHALPTNVNEELSSATMTATEESGMETVEKGFTTTEGIKSPTLDSETIGPKPNELGNETAVSELNKSDLGVQQSGTKRRRKPYRPGIGGFTVRQRGRGGFFKPRGRRTLPPPIPCKDTTEGSKTDQVTSETASDATAIVPPAPTPSLPQGTSGDSGQPKQTDSNSSKPTFSADPAPSIVTPVKLKTGTSATTKARRKKRMRLIDQFPPYLQDAFFGKDVLAEAETKSTPFDNMNEKPASPTSGYRPKQSSDSRLILPDRITQRLEAQANQQSSQSYQPQGHLKSHRHPSQPADEDAILMDRENEQELLGVLPDLPFKDDELLGMISSDLKQEQGGGESHENILSPSSLEKLVRDEFDGLQNVDSDMAALFSHVLNPQNEPAAKQDNIPQNGVSGVTHSKTEPMQRQNVQETRPQAPPHESMQMQQSNVTSSQQQRQLAIQQELQQIEKEQQHIQRQRQQDVMQRQMSVNIPPTGYGITQQEQNIQGHPTLNMDQNRGMPGPSNTPRPHGITIMPQHGMDPSRPRSHQGASMSPLMGSTSQQHSLSIGQIRHPGHSPHPTPPPPMFSRQTSMPVLPGMQNQTQIQTEVMHSQQIQHTMQNQASQNVITQQPHPKGTMRAQSMVIGASTSTIDTVSLQHNVYQDIRGTDSFPGPVPVSMKPTCVTTPALIQPVSSTHNTMAQNQTLSMSQPALGFHSSTQQQGLPLPPEAYLTSTVLSIPTTTNTAASIHKRSSSLPAVTQAGVVGDSSGVFEQQTTATLNQNPHPIQTQPVMSTATSQSSDNVTVPPHLPSFASEAIFEPSPPPWPLGTTDLDGESPSVNQRNILKWEKDEPLGELATISPVLYSNVKYPELKKEFPDWQSRSKQISKLWRKTTPEERAPFLSKAKDNRALQKSSRARRGDNSKTPTPPIPMEVTDSKSQVISAHILRKESKLQLMRLAQVQGLLDGFEDAEKTDAALQPSPSEIRVYSSSESHTTQTPAVASTVATAPVTDCSSSFAEPSASSVSSGVVVDVKPAVVGSSAVASQSVASNLPQPGAAFQSPAKNIQPKTERHVSLDTQAQSSPFPQSRTPVLTPSVQDSPTKSVAAAVTRSHSVGAALTEQASQNPEDHELKNRRLSVDSQLQQITAPHDTDVKPQISASSSATVRPGLHQSTSQRSARRARLWEQSQSQPPPPYPSVSTGTIQTLQGLMYPQIGPRGQVLPITGPRTGPPGALLRTPSPVIHNSGVMSFPFEGTPQQGLMHGHPLTPQHPAYPAGVHPVKGYKGQHPPGAYIELRHTNDSDPATRRQNILRISNVALSDTSTSQSQPTTKDTSSTASSSPVQIKTEVKTKDSSAETKAEDPFAGGVMPHDEHLDALLRSEEFKDLHFQGARSVSTATAAIPSTSAESVVSHAHSVAGTVTTATETESQTSALPVVTDEGTSKEKGTLPKENDTSTDKCAPNLEIPKSSDKKNDGERDKNDSVDETKENEKISVNVADEKGDNNQVVVTKETDHCYSKSAEAGPGDGSIGSSKTAEDPNKIDESPAKAEEVLATLSEVDEKDLNQQPRGVGLTPPPESEVGFLPTFEESKQDSATSLTVSNVITVPGTPPEVGESNVKILEEAHAGVVKQTKSGEKHTEDVIEKNDEKGNVEDELKLDVLASEKEENREKEDEVHSESIKIPTLIDIPTLPKSPVAPPLSQKIEDSATSKQENPPSVIDEEGTENPESESQEKPAHQEINIEAKEAVSSLKEGQPQTKVVMDNVEKLPASPVDKSTENGSGVLASKVIPKSGEDVEMSSSDQGKAEKDEPNNVEKADEGEECENGKSIANPEEPSLEQKLLEKTAPSSLPFTDVATVISSTASVHARQVDTAHLGSSVVVSQPPVGQRKDISQSAQTITVVRTSIATVTAYKQPLPPIVQTSGTMSTTLTETSNTPTQSSDLPLQVPVTQLGLTGMSHLATSTALVGSDIDKAPIITPVVCQSPTSTSQVTGPAGKEEAKSTTPRQKTLLIKEQPLLLQELLDEEKREQEKARREKMRHSQTLIPQQVAVQQPGMTPGVYTMPGGEIEKVASESGIDSIKMELLSRVNQAAKVGLVMPPAAAEGQIVQPGPGTLHIQQQAWQAGSVAGTGIQQTTGTPVSGNEAEIRQYCNWLIQQQRLFQIQVPKQEQLMQTKKTRKQSLMKKRNQYKRNGKEFSAEDAEELKLVTKQYTEAQQTLEKLRNDQKQHTELMNEFNLRQNRLVGSIPSGIGQQQQVGATMDGQPQPQQLMVQHPAASAIQQQPGQQLIVPQFQNPGMQQNVPPQQIVMMQPGGQQQLIIKSIPASTNIPGTLSSAVASAAIGVQQQPQAVVASQQTQNQSQAFAAQFQKPAGIRPGNPQFQQVMMNQRQFQQSMPQQQPPDQKSNPTPRMQYAPPSVVAKEQAPPTSGVGSSTTPAHEALMQMQLQQLKALQMEQRQQKLAAEQNPDKPKQKRKRKKKKTQAEKEGEEKLALVTQQLQQVQYVAPNIRPEWQQPQHTMGQGLVQIHPMVAQQHQQQHRFSSPSGQMPPQPPTPTSTPALMRPLSQPQNQVPLAFPPASGVAHTMPQGSSMIPSGNVTQMNSTSVPLSNIPMVSAHPGQIHSAMTLQQAGAAHSGQTIITPSPGVVMNSPPPFGAQATIRAPMSSGVVVSLSQRPVDASMVSSTHVAPVRSKEHIIHQSSNAVNVPPAVMSKMPTSTPSTLLTVTPSLNSQEQVAHTLPTVSRNPSLGAPPFTAKSGRSAPRSQSPRHALGNFEGLSESEFAIIMAHDPDLTDNTRPAVSTPAQKPETPHFQATTSEQDAKTDDAKLKKVKKGSVVMDRKIADSMDDSIEKVVRLSADYEDRLQFAKSQNVAAVTPSPWELDPKPTKFPPKRIPETAVRTQNGMRGLLSHSQFAPPGMMQGMASEVMAVNQMQKGMPMGMVSYPMKPPEVTTDPSQKKKRPRKASKEVGPDGKPIKRRRKKDKNGMQQQFPMGVVEGNMQGVMVRPSIQGGKPGVMAPMVPFPGSLATNGSVPVGQISPGQSVSGEIGKVVSQWKPLPLLRLSEPAIRETHHMCVPEGTGVTSTKNIVKGLLAESTYANIPDYFEVVLGLKLKIKPAKPLTPPSSQPASPSGEMKPAVQSSQSEAVTVTSDTTIIKSASTISRPEQSGKYGPLGLSPDGITTPTSSASTAGMPSVKIPESFPTPPHHGIEDKDDILKPQKFADDAIVPPSSPEMEDEDDWAPHALSSLRNDQLSLAIKAIKSEKIRDSPSPTIPFMLHPKISIPPGGRGKSLNDKDAVSVTVEFGNANIKSIEKSLTLLSRILDAPIISYTMVKSLKQDKKLKEALNQSIKKEQLAVSAAPTSQSNQVIKSQTDETVTQAIQEQRRCCLYCKTVVNGNGVRMPKFNGSAYEEDDIYCNKDCFIKYELQEKKAVPTTPTKKKFKASHVYQRHIQKINMETLLEQYPDEEPATPSKNTRSSVESIYFPSGVQDMTRTSISPGGRGRGRRRGPGDEVKVAPRRWKGVKWKKWSTNIAIVKSIAKPPADIESLLVKYGSALKPPQGTVDKRTCVFCGVRGDGDTHTIARLLNVDVDRWVHLNCALWSAEVYETQGGALINVDLAWRRSESVLCCLCQKKGATIHCHRPRCVNTYHCQCALDIKCVFFKDKTVLCPTHAPKPGISLASTGLSTLHHQSGDTLRSLAVFRKVYVQRPETKQIASIMQQGELTQGEKNFVLRVGALIFENVGQLATHQMADCHTKTAIYPIGYRATRMYWSQTNMRRRCRYECSVNEVDGKPLFMMSYKAALPGKNKPDKLLTHVDTVTAMENSNVNGLWMEVLSPLEKLRSQHSVLKLFPAHINGEKLFGLTIPVVSRILESLPNIELCAEYKFRYGRTPLLEVPLAINPTGCARSEPHIKQHRKKPHTLISNLISEYYESSGIGDASSLYGKQFVHSKSSQYRKMKNEWRSNVYLARSRIQGLGLFAARDIEPGTMVIEYIGDIIRTEVSEKREKMYEVANRGVYMFRLDCDHIVDATVTGGPARYINHSCKPNCVAEVVNFEKEKKIMIVSNRHILKGEELSYDYKFDFEDEGRKIPCLCGASNCKKWMN